LEPLLESQKSREADAKLLGRLADGDETALAALYAAHSEAVLALSMRFLGSRGEAEDLAHDVFVEAWRTAVRFDASRGSARTWLLVKTRARALDRLRSPRLARRVDRERVERTERVTKQNAAERQSDSARALRAMADLPEPQRRVLELAYLGGLSSSEISSRLGIPIGTVKSRVASGLRRLRETLNGTALCAGELQ
jgi:RNA polymerase sigma-70 factor (ECF subfamily)